MARVVFTVGWTMNITVNAVQTSVATTLRMVHEYALHSNVLVVNNVVYKMHGICDLGLIKKIKCRYTINAKPTLRVVQTDIKKVLFNNI